MGASAAAAGTMAATSPACNGLGLGMACGASEVSVMAELERAFRLATRIESRIGCRRRDAMWVRALASSSCVGTGGRPTRSAAPSDGRLRNDRAVSQR